MPILPAQTIHFQQTQIAYIARITRRQIESNQAIEILKNLAEKTEKYKFAIDSRQLNKNTHFD
ncbi:MAG: hypothetical protein ACBR16_22005 [Microcoleus sp.]